MVWRGAAVAVIGLYALSDWLVSACLVFSSFFGSRASGRRADFGGAGMLLRRQHAKVVSAASACDIAAQIIVVVVASLATAGGEELDSEDLLALPVGAPPSILFLDHFRRMLTPIPPPHPPHPTSPPPPSHTHTTTAAAAAATTVRHFLLYLVPTLITC